jgi:hypothetical protein
MTEESSSCQKHHKLIEFFCAECSQYLCADCLFEELSEKHHTGHSISRMTDIFGSLKVELANSLLKLNSITQSIQQRAMTVRQSVSRLELVSSEQMRAMIRFVEASQAQSARSLRQYHDALRTHADRLRTLREQAKGIADSEVTDLSAIPRAVSEIQSLRAQIEEAVKPVPVPEPQNDILPPFQSARFTVHNLRQAIDSARHETTPVCLYTPTQEIYGCLWRLKIYPFGNMNGRSTHVSVFVEMSRGTGVKTPYGYRIEIVPADVREHTFVREFRSDFTVNDSWGWNKAILIERVSARGFLSDEGDLAIVLSLKPESYYHAYRDLRVAMAEERTKYEALKATVSPE